MLKYLEDDPTSKLNFRVPSFPFCRTCNKNNDSFMQNRSYLMLKDSKQNKILYPKTSFIKKLASGELRLSKNIDNVKMIKDAMEQYQLRNGASPESDFGSGM